MGLLRPDANEVKLKREMAYEYFGLYGVDGLIYEIDTENENLYGDDHHSYKPAIPIPMIFQQFPDIRTLKKLGWYNQDKENLPWIMLIPFYDQDGNELAVQHNVKLEFVSEAPGVDVEAFKIKKLAGKGFSALYWVANVVPIAEHEAESDPADDNGDGYTFLNGG